jgi:L-threonylcarbamoyladenylate synthase
VKIIKGNSENVGEIAAALKNGAVLVLPTDTIYGLVCDATNKKAVDKIFDIKKREKSKPLPVFVENIEMAKKYAVVNEKQQDFLKNNWPGAVTVVLEKKDGLSPLVYKDNTIALRQPNYRLMAEVMKLFGGPLAQTSVNISNDPPLEKIDEIINSFTDQKNQPDLIVSAGDLIKNKPSVIIDLTKDKINILRQ